MPRFSLPWSRREQFSTSISDIESFAAWLAGTPTTTRTVTPYTVLGLAAVIRAVTVISTTIAALPFRTYERQGDDRVRVPSVFDDPYPGIDGMTPFAWVETVIIHLLLWRKAFLWHDALDGAGRPSIYRPILPDKITKVERRNGRKVFTYTDPEGVVQEVGSEQITHIPGPSLDGLDGHPILFAARAIFSAALAGDESASNALSKGIRLAGLITPGEGEDIDPAEGEEILKQLRPSLLGPDSAGDIAFINRRLKLDRWTATNVESQVHETRGDVLMLIEQFFGMPPHLMADTEKQTSWGTGVAEQNLGLARYTLLNWSPRIEQVLTLRLPDGSNAGGDGTRFCEFDYKGLLQGTPAQEIELLIAQVDAGLLTDDEARQILNRPPLTPKQKAAIVKRTAPATPKPIPQERPA
jgi:HK97 family phage portal protein